MKRILLSAAAAGLALGVLVCLLAWWQWTRPCPLPRPADGGSAPEAVLVRIQPGMTLSAAADTLVARGLLANRRVLLLGARLTGQQRALRAGLFELRHGLSPRGLLEDLTAGRAVQVRITLQEGLTSRRIAELLAGSLGFAADDFLAAADSLVRAAVIRDGLLWPDAVGRDAATGDPLAVRLDSLLAQTGGLDLPRVNWCEGYLAPDTYLFAEGTSPEFAARHLVDEQMRRLREAVKARTPREHDLTPHELLTLASLVEAEARVSDERALVAAVYTNRLEKNWRLEADPTVAFILEKTGQRLYFKDLKVQSPYNTYLEKGLPPGPISNPGPQSLMAAARPDSSCRAMYFVSDGAGGHVFSRTIQEHEAAVRRFRKIRAAASRH